VGAASIIVSGCGPFGGSESAPTGYLTHGSDVAVFLQWTRVGDSLTGTWTEACIQASNQTQVQNTSGGDATAVQADALAVANDAQAADNDANQVKGDLDRIHSDIASVQSDLQQLQQDERALPSYQPSGVPPQQQLTQATTSAQAVIAHSTQTMNGYLAQAKQMAQQAHSYASAVQQPTNNT
jgi:hypothetical protein